MPLTLRVHYHSTSYCYYYTNINATSKTNSKLCYRYDFQLFNYTIDNYYEIVDQDETSSHG